MSSRLVRSADVSDLEVSCHVVDFAQRVEMLLHRHDRIPDYRGDLVRAGQMETVTVLTLTPCTDSSAPLTPSVILSLEAATRMMDTLWLAGIRPTQAQDPNRQIAALTHHLADMRALAFRKVPKDLKD